MKPHTKILWLMSSLVGVLFTLLPLPANAVLDANSLSDTNDLKFKSGFVADSIFLTPNTTFRRENSDDLKSPAVVLLHSCGGITYKSRQDLNRWKNFLTSSGFAVLVVDSLSTRDVKNNCGGRSRAIGKERLVKDMFDAVAHLSNMPEIDASRIFVLGFSLGAMTAGISGDMAGDRRYADKPQPRAVAGLYGGCRYGSGNWLASKSAFPILWLMGDKDLESPAANCISDLKSLESQGIGSEWHIYKDATHCWDCASLHGTTRTSGNGAKSTYLFDEQITRDSEQRVLQFFEKFPSTTSNK